MISVYTQFMVLVYTKCQSHLYMVSQFGIYADHVDFRPTYMSTDTIYALTTLARCNVTRDT